MTVEKVLVFNFANKQKIIIYCGSDYNKIKKIKCGKGEISDG
jgi:hypothetical protein